MSIEGVLEKGFVTTSLDSLINWARKGSATEFEQLLRQSVFADNGETTFCHRRKNPDPSFFPDFPP